VNRRNAWDKQKGRLKSGSTSTSGKGTWNEYGRGQSKKKKTGKEEGTTLLSGTLIPDGET